MGRPVAPDQGSGHGDPSVELPLSRALLHADASGHDIGARVVLTLDLRAGEPAQHRELADVGQRVGDRALKDRSAGAAIGASDAR